MPLLKLVAFHSGWLTRMILLLDFIEFTRLSDVDLPEVDYCLYSSWCVGLAGAILYLPEVDYWGLPKLHGSRQSDPLFARGGLLPGPPETSTPRSVWVSPERSFICLRWTTARASVYLYSPRWSGLARAILYLPEWTTAWTSGHLNSLRCMGFIGAIIFCSWWTTSFVVSEYDVTQVLASHSGTLYLWRNITTLPKWSQITLKPCTLGVVWLCVLFMICAFRRLCWEL